MTKKQIGSEPIYDARALGTPRMLVLGLQHMFAMFGATVLVPALTGLDVATTLLFAGLGTLLFHLLTKGKSPRSSAPRSRSSAAIRPSPPTRNPSFSFTPASASRRRVSCTSSSPRSSRPSA